MPPLLAFLIGAAAPQAAPAPAPSFDCRSATEPVEVSICTDPKLAAADALMARLFPLVTVSAFGDGPSHEVAVQREWLNARKTACSGAPAADRSRCLLRVLNERNESLAVAALFRDPALAGATLRKIDPEAAPLFDAIHFFASEAPGTDWRAPAMATKRALLLALLEPYARRLAEDESLSFGRAILAPGLTSAADALGSEAAFASFVQVTSAYLGDGPTPRAMPCAAVVRHPALLAATGPVFGSTLDGFVLAADCDETLPATPRFDALVDAINKGWPACDGTIRFAAYRSFALAVTKARVATEGDLGRRVGGPMPRRKGVGAAEVNAAMAELGRYYIRYRRASPARAGALATATVRGVLAAGQRCG